MNKPLQRPRPVPSENRMDMIRHYQPRDLCIAYAVEMLQRPTQFDMFTFAQQARAMAGIEAAFYRARKPPMIQGRVREAIEQWQETVATEPENGNAKSNLAWVFATYPEASFRDGPKAVQLAEQALKLSGGENPIIFRTLAAAYAESGRLPEAVDTAQRGLELATSRGNTGLATEFQSYILLYRAGSPLRDTSLTNGRSSP